MGDSAILKKNLFDLVDIVNRFCLGDSYSKDGTAYLVIPIDDTDCQIQKAHDVMEDIRCYLTIPNTLILMATDGDMLLSLKPGWTEESLNRSMWDITQKSTSPN